MGHVGHFPLESVRGATSGFSTLVKKAGNQNKAGENLHRQSRHLMTDRNVLKQSTTNLHIVTADESSVLVGY